MKCRKIQVFSFLYFLLFFYGALLFASEGTTRSHFIRDFINTGGKSAILYDSNNGLFTSEANAIAETPEGFIWIGGYSGLIRYDGNTFDLIDPNYGVASVVSLYVDKIGHLWIGTNDSGVAVMEKGSIKKFSKKDGLPSSCIRALAEDSDGNIYVATTAGLAVIDSDFKVKTVNVPQLKNAYIRSLRLGKNGVLYGVAINRSFFTMKDKVITGCYDCSEFGVEGIRYALPDPENPDFVYLGSENSTIHYVKLNRGRGLKKIKTINISPLMDVSSIYAYRGDIWVTAGNGIGVIKEDGFHVLDGIPMDSNIGSMMADFQGNMWFTSSRQGVMKIVPNQFTDVFDQYELEESVVNSTCIWNKLLFLGTDKGLIVLDEKEKLKKLPLVNSVSDDLIKWLDGCRIRSIICDSKNRLWISTWGKYGLICYDGKGVKIFSENNGLPSNRVRTVCEKDGIIYAACSGGCAVIKDGKVSALYAADRGINNLEILSIAVGDNGDILLGSDGDGIYVISKDGDRHISTDTGLKSDIVMRIKKDADYNLFWIITSNSIAWLNGYDYSATTVEQFPYLNNYDMFENKKREMWILSSNGVYVVEKASLLKNGKIDPAYFSKNNGLPHISTGNSYSYLTEDGDLYIAGTSGVTKVNIENSFSCGSSVRMGVPYLIADGKFLYPDENGNFKVSSSVSKITVCNHIYSYSLTNPSLTYFLEGFEHYPSTVYRNEMTQPVYTNLPGGRYRFVMQVRDSSNHETGKFYVNIEKEKSFTETLLYKILCFALSVLLAFIIGYFSFRRKTAALLQRQKRDKTLIREIVEAFAKTIDIRDKYTNGHSSRVAKFTACLTKELGYDDETVEKYYNTALLHDIGKIGIPSSILNKPGKLTEEEYKIVQSHSKLGFEVLNGISIMPELATGAGFHHERPDGLGYPSALTLEKIPRVAQIIAVADTFDAMYSNRPYRKRMKFENVVSVIKEVSGSQLAPDVVDAFLRLVEKGIIHSSEENMGSC